MKQKKHVKMHICNAISYSVQPYVIKTEQSQVIHATSQGTFESQAFRQQSDISGIYTK